MTAMWRVLRLPLLLFALASLGLTAAACGSDDTTSAQGDGAATLTVYSGQHEELARALAAAFTEKTGIEIELRSGEDADLANQIQEEGEKTKADVLLTEEPGAVAMLAKAGRFAAVEPSSLAQVDQRFVPASGDWMPYAARSRVIYYNPDLIAEADLPHSILDLVKPEWKGRFAYAPSGAFASTVAYLATTIGDAKTLAWLKGIKANGVDEQSNGKVRDTVEAGQHPFGLSNHYYWWRLAQEKGGANKLTSKIHYFNHPDAGGLVLPSGAAILKTSDHQAEAQKFLAWLGSPDGGQQIVAGGDAEVDGAQYPVAPGVESQVGLPPIGDLQTPKLADDSFADTSKAKELMIEAGIV